MAQRFHNIELNESIFPMLSEQQGRTILRSDSEKDDPPSIAYCHNVMPSDRGFDSVAFLSIIASFPNIPVGLSFVDTRIVYGDLKTRLDIAWDSFGNVYALLSGATAWIAIPATVPTTGGGGFTSESVTIGTVNGVSHIFYSGIGSFTYNEATNRLDAETLTGLNILNTLGVVASSGYLVAYTTLAIAWSSTIDPTDFVPSVVTGSGGGNVAGIAGAILFVVSNSLGLVVYTKDNTVAGTYTGNVQFPFKFRPIDNAKGGISLDLVAYETDATSHFVFSKAGMQTITSQRAEIIIPEVTDFLGGKRFEDYNEVTRLYEVTDLIAKMKKKIKYIASRYLVISYGISSFTHALIFDLALKKLGKVKLTHADCFEYIGEQTEISKESIGFLLPDGEVKVLDFSTQADSSGVLILGKLQFIRTRFLTLLGVEVENVETDSTLSVSTQASLDGKNFTSVEGTVRSSANNLREYAFRSSAKNHSIVFIGKFNTVTALVRYTIGGRR